MICIHINSSISMKKYDTNEYSEKKTKFKFPSTLKILSALRIFGKAIFPSWLSNEVINLDLPMIYLREENDMKENRKNIQKLKFMENYPKIVKSAIQYILYQGPDNIY